MKQPKKLRIILSSLVCLWALSPGAWAALGSKDDTLDAEAATFSAKHTEKILPKYRLHELTTTGLDVKQYADKNGVVFGVSWRGSHNPDLKVLFGLYFQDYSQALKAPTHRLTRGGPRTFRGANIVVVQSGHMRSVFGRAYSPNLIPVGVTASDIK